MVLEHDIRGSFVLKMLRQNRESLRIHLSTLSLIPTHIHTHTRVYGFSHCQVSGQMGNKKTQLNKMLVFILPATGKEDSKEAGKNPFYCGPRRWCWRPFKLFAALSQISVFFLAAFALGLRLCIVPFLIYMLPIRCMWQMYLLLDYSHYLGAIADIFFGRVHVEFVYLNFVFFLKLGGYNISRTIQSPMSCWLLRALPFVVGQTSVLSNFNHFVGHFISLHCLRFYGRSGKRMRASSEEHPFIIQFSYNLNSFLPSPKP